jgi:hypothetical protein
MNTRFLAASLFVAASALTSPSSAALIIYSETADISGSLNGVGFSDDVLTLTLFGNTSDVSGGPSFFFLTAPLNFSLSGVGSGTFTDEVGVIVNQSVPTAGFGDFTSDFAILDTFSSAFVTYDLSTAIGPVSGGAIYNGGTGFATTAGTLIIGSVSGDATFTATIPEPATWAMMALGFAALGLVGYARGGPRFGSGAVPGA